MRPRRSSARRPRAGPPAVFELDLHGLSEADAIEKMLAALARWEGDAGASVRVVHGRGAGVLARAARRVARIDPRIADLAVDPTNAGVCTWTLSGRRLRGRDEMVRIALAEEPPHLRSR